MNKKNFYNTIRNAFGKLNQSQVNALEFLLSKFENSGLSIPQFAYVLATIKHETADTYQPVVEGYWINNNRLQKLYNFYKNNYKHNLKTIFPNGTEGKTYEGRGYVQLTHNYNYKKFGLLDNPDKALEPETAWDILLKGMKEGLFTGKKLSDYINGKKDYVNARKIINGLDRANLIASYAKVFETALKN
jgi:predicted chitinase